MATPLYATSHASLVDLVRSFAWAPGSLSAHALFTALDLAHEFCWPEREHARWLVIGPPHQAPDPTVMRDADKRAALKIGERFAASADPDQVELLATLRTLLGVPGARSNSLRANAPNDGPSARAA